MNPETLPDRIRVFLLLALTLAGCSTVREGYYNTVEKVTGKQRRDILVSRVKSARDEQDAAKQQFKTTLQQFQEITHFNGGDLEAKYEKLKGEYDRCKSRADAVSSKVRAVENVAKSMFNEWADENKQFTDEAKRRENEKLLDETKARYGQLIALMRRSEDKMKPVLGKFNDSVLDMKHKLNASAISSLQGTAKELDVDVQSLIKDMEASIADADEFVKKMK